MSKVATFARNADGSTTIIYTFGERGDKTPQISLFGLTLSDVVLDPLRGIARTTLNRDLQLHAEFCNRPT